MLIMSSAFRSVLAAAVVAATASATFNAASKQNVVTYWGQGPYQQRLVETCKNPDIDIINIGFIDVFPDQGPGGWPGDNFGNACWGDVYEHDGVNTTLLKTCPYIGEDVTACQTTYGKKIFLSIGGAYPQDYYIDSNESGANFAEFLWGAFGPSSANNGQPRPWGDACVDGFDFDIESEISPAPTNSAGQTIAYKTNGYAAMITHFKNVLFPQDTSKNYFISGAPQCTLPDAHYTTVMKNAWFDFLWIQFYNTAACSARAGIQKLNGKGTNDISFSAWEQATSLNPNVKYYIGLPASEAASNDATYYLTPAEVQRLVQKFGKTAGFGGIMLWEATYDQNNTICGEEYSVWMKKILSAEAKGTTLDTKTCPTTTSSVATSSSTQSTTHSSTTKVVKAEDDSTGLSTTSSHSPNWNGSATSPMVGPTGTGATTTNSHSLHETSYTTYTTICTENGTTTLHTHSAPITPTGPTHTSTGTGTGTVSRTRSTTGRPTGIHGSSSTSCTESDFTTYTTVCTETSSGSTYITTHTHSAPVSPVSTSSRGVVTVTSFTSIYVTTCPVTATYTSGWNTLTSTYESVSTVTTVITETLTAYPSSSPVGPVSTTSPGGEMTTTEYTTVYTTICPVTETMHSGGSTSTWVHSTTSTLTSVVTSTIWPSHPAGGHQTSTLTSVIASTIWPSHPAGEQQTSTLTSVIASTIWPSPPAGGHQTSHGSYPSSPTVEIETATPSPYASSTPSGPQQTGSWSEGSGVWPSSATLASSASWPAGSGQWSSPAAAQSASSTVTVLQTMTVVPSAASPVGAQHTGGQAPPYEVGSASNNGTWPATATGIWGSSSTSPVAAVYTGSAVVNSLNLGGVAAAGLVAALLI